MNESKKHRPLNYILAFGSSLLLLVSAIGTIEFADWAFGDSDSGFSLVGIGIFIPLAIIAMLTAGYYRSLFGNGEMVWFWWASTVLNALFTAGIVFIMLTIGLGFGYGLPGRIVEIVFPVWTGFAMFASLYNTRS